MTKPLVWGSAVIVGKSSQLGAALMNGYGGWGDPFVIEHHGLTGVGTNRDRLAAFGLVEMLVKCFAVLSVLLDPLEEFLLVESPCLLGRLSDLADDAEASRDIHDCCCIDDLELGRGFAKLNHHLHGRERLLARSDQLRVVVVND